MEYEQQLRLQGYLDGELPEQDAAAVAGQISRDPEAAALVDELRCTSRVLRGAEEARTLPESRDFFWSKIEREIRRQEEPTPDRVREVSFSALLRRLLMPITAVALLVMIGLVATRDTSQPWLTETQTKDAGTFTYHDFSSGATLVWLSYPAENEVAVNNDADTFDY